MCLLILKDLDRKTPGKHYTVVFTPYTIYGIRKNEMINVCTKKDFPDYELIDEYYSLVAAENWRDGAAVKAKILEDSRLALLFKHLADPDQLQCFDLSPLRDMINHVFNLPHQTKYLHERCCLLEARLDNWRF